MIPPLRGTLTLATTLILATALLPALPAAGADLAFAWESLFEGARNEALGSGDLAAPAGPEAILSTPAAFAGGPDGIEAGSGYFEYSADLTLRHYAVAADLGRWRFQSGWSEVSADVTSPEDPATTVEAVDRIRTFGVVRQLSGAAAVRRPRLAVGASVRQYASRLGDRESSGNGLDVGLIGDCPLVLGEGAMTLGAALALRNVFGATLDFDDQEADLPEHWRAGLAFTLESGPWLGMPGGARLQALYTRRQGLDAWRFYDADLFGAEVTLGGVLALRVGSDSYQFAGADRVGLGVILYAPERWPLGVWADWTHQHRHPDAVEGLDMYAVRARLDF